MSDAREQVEKTADRLREELLTTLQELDRRRARATDFRYQLEQHEAALWIACAAAVGVGAGVWALGRVKKKHRRRTLRKKRLEGARRAWRHPERLAVTSEERPFPVELGKRVLMTFVLAISGRLAHRAARSLVPEAERTEAKEPSQRYLS